LLVGVVAVVEPPPEFIPVVAAARAAYSRLLDIQLLLARL
jgi:hypothetical protein